MEEFFLYFMAFLLRTYIHENSLFRKSNNNKNHLASYIINILLNITDFLALSLHTT